MTDLIDLEVGAPAHGGHCVARYEGRVVFVRHALPGETVRARLTESGADARFWRADAVEVVDASPDRVDSVWPEAGPGGVGGGELAHVSLAGQRAWKLAVLRESFERFASLDYPGDVLSVPAALGRGDDEETGLGYRTRVSAIANAEGDAAMHLHRSREVRALASMPLASAALEKTLIEGRFPARSRIAIAESSTGELRVLADGVPWRAGKLDKRPNAPRAVHEHVAVGERSWDFRVDAAGFWQVHRDAPAVLVTEVLQRVGDAERVADLYSGAGLLSVPLAEGGREVVAIESDDDGARAARRNAHAAPSLRVIHGDVRLSLAEGLGELDAVVLDPPRSGAGAATIAALADTGVPRVVYVACDPVALARDVALLNGHGYDLVDASAVDLFPMTHHVETMATFERR
ncbi:class I SAM-dependent RNA methyltransferase [Demequina muriae]|uniref:TRAM domain-containing protein n=1 Tax=Demequina muriae TaxID=3051664 RepID=A0ABT8GJJ5_9MICO|nr:TRAM domain-containing protein [Demequina sp. EGI L300058]MDN4481597.1 TRAM domain-containing protein [Demequina sp. EGI L300058]